MSHDCFCLCGPLCQTEDLKNAADKCSGSIQSGMIPEGSFEVRGTTYKFLYKQWMYRKTARFLVVLGVWNDKSGKFDIDKMVDEVVSEFDMGVWEDQKAKVEEKIATTAKKAPAPIKKVCKKPSARVANSARGCKAFQKMLAHGFKASQKMLN